MPVPQSTYPTYRNRLPEKSQMSSGKSGLFPHLIASQTKPLFSLSWSQYVFLISIENAEERYFYEIEAAANE